jgi:hypothetical protein
MKRCLRGFALCTGIFGYNKIPMQTATFYFFANPTMLVNRVELSIPLTLASSNAPWIVPDSSGLCGRKMKTNIQVRIGI